MKKVFFVVLLFSFLLAGCGGDDNSVTNDSGNTTSEESTLKLPPFPVDINAPYNLALDENKEGDYVAKNFFDTVCLGDMENQVTTFKGLFLTDEDLSELQKVSDTHWVSDYMTVDISSEDGMTVVTILFNPIDPLGNNETVIKFKPDYSYVELVAYAQGSPTMSIKGSMEDDGNRGRLEYYSGKFEVLGDVFSYSVEDTMVTSRLEGYDKGTEVARTTLTEDNQSNPQWGECISESYMNGVWKLVGRIRWQGEHGHYVVYDAEGTLWEGDF